ncbi:modification methylase [Candidatus Magnetobacterium bavaricum]|uniref:Site-specific DNA-methyltransferase (adenine-specific) n=1 Tax=Candidatus Magnetobacterium bavaricum TaxID=29290 RepID=A0A0F3GVQ6_9BACT|nr:modification methylase [Candidatus Magnetobacterium bavaricum]
MKPFLKWAGGKTRLLPELLKYVPETYDTYVEPFLGGGAMLFELTPTRAVVSDVCFGLIRLYKDIKHTPGHLISSLEWCISQHSEQTFYKMRDCYNNTVFNKEQLSAMFLYLNKSCYNGLHRENSNGDFNVPFGKYKSIKWYDKTNILSIRDYLCRQDVEIKCQSFSDALKNARPGDFVYCDPPYHNGFTAYTVKGFTERDQADLARICSDLAAKGCHILASNSNTDYIKQLWGQYGCFDIHEVEAPRSISCKGNGRVKVKELIITNVRREER